tara:strand:- start:3494 stop:4471 length:978 start_codon:yes stop_codon:yes gene_type:complete
MIYTIRLKAMLIFFSLFSCNKEETKKEVLEETIEFSILGSDGPYMYGETYTGRNGYTTYYPGNIPIILSIPHGGDISPSEISNRTYGVTVTDSNTIELGISIRNYFYTNYNIRPYVIINNLKRTKLDANRDKIEAAQGNIYAERAFDEFHFYIETAREDIVSKFYTGLLFDIHGHGVNPDGFNDLRTWIGYLLTGDQLDNSNDFIDQNISTDEVSIYSLLNASGQNLSELLSGPNSLGALFENYNYSALPSPESRSPEGMRYFSGGYNTYKYGTNRNFNFSSIQLEFPFQGLRDTPQSRNLFSSIFADIVQEYFLIHFNIDLFSL